MVNTAQGDFAPVTTNVGEQLETNSLRGLPFLLFILLSLVLAADGFDLLVLGFVAPVIGREFGLSRIGLGWLTTFSHSGVALGGVLGGLYGDRCGRRPALIWGVCLFGSFGLLCANTYGVALFALFRFLSSIGLGAVTPNVAAYLTDILPARWRSRLTILTFTLSALGATVCGLFARSYATASEWRTLFVAGGSVPLLLVIAIWFLLPESPQYLLGVRGRETQLAKALSRLVGHRIFAHTERFISTGAESGTVGPRALFEPAYLRDTVALWVLTFAVMFSSIAITSMGTVILTSAGVAIKSAVAALLAFNICGILGGLCAALLIPKLGSRGCMSLLVIAGTTGLILLAQLLHQGAAPTAIIAAAGLCGFGLSGLWMVTYPLIAQTYPAGIRAIGTGAALTFGRIGSVLSAIFVAALLTRTGPPEVLVSLAAIAALALLALWHIRRHIAS